MKLGDALRELVRKLDVMNIGYAVVGGLAASAHGEARFTRDVDIAVAVDGDEEAEGVVFELRKLGYEVLATVEQQAANRLATARLQSPTGVVCDLIFATCGIEAEVIESAQSIEILPDVVVRTASVESILALKTLSATSARPRDLGDIRAILRAHADFDERRLLLLLATITDRGFARGQSLEEKWLRLRSELGA